MEELKKQMETRRKQLLKVKREKEKALEIAPVGTLRICGRGNRTQYYQRIDPKDTNGIYIRDEAEQIARDLAQKDYDKKVLEAVKKELAATENYLRLYPQTNGEQIYESLHKERQKLVEPIMETEEQYIRKWENVEYQGKEFYEDMPELYTAKGERVRSKSEIIIADSLYREGIPYRYEAPVYLKGMGTVYPDFTVLNIRLRKEFYWEHLGMMDEEEYAENAVKKINCYEQNEIFQGDQLILTYETRKSPINPQMIMGLIRQYLY